MPSAARRRARPPGRCRSTQSGQSDSMVSSRNPGQRRTGGRRRSVKQSSHGPGGGGTSSAVAIPAASRRYIAPASTSSSQLTRSYPGCAARTTGATRSRRASARRRGAPAGRSGCRRSARSAGRPPPRTASPARARSTIVVASTTCQGRSRTVPWMACGGIVAGSAQDRPTERELGIADPAGVRRHRVRAPVARPIMGRLEQLATIDHERRDAPARDQIHHDLDAWRREAQRVWIGGRRIVRRCAGGRRIAGQPDRHRPPARAAATGASRPLGHHLVDRRRRAEDLLVEPDEHPADGLADRLGLLLALLSHLGSLDGARSVTEP